VGGTEGKVMSRKPTRAEKKADRALCPIAAAQVLGIKVHTVASAMRAAGVNDAITVKQAKAWKAMTQDPPAWMVTLMADKAVGSARRIGTLEDRRFEDQHRKVLAEDQVVTKLLAGEEIRGDRCEVIAADFAFRAMKDLVRAGGEVEGLDALALAALRWAGVDPKDRSTWFLARGRSR